MVFQWTSNGCSMMKDAVAVHVDHRAVLVISRARLIAEKKHLSTMPGRGDKTDQDLRDVECLTRDDEADEAVCAGSAFLGSWDLWRWALTAMQPKTAACTRPFRRTP